MGGKKNYLIPLQQREYNSTTKISKVVVSFPGSPCKQMEITSQLLKQFEVVSVSTDASGPILECHFHPDPQRY